MVNLMKKPRPRLLLLVSLRKPKHEGMEAETECQVRYHPEPEWTESSECKYSDHSDCSGKAKQRLRSLVGRVTRQPKEQIMKAETVCLVQPGPESDRGT